MAAFIHLLLLSIFATILVHAKGPTWKLLYQNDADWSRALTSSNATLQVGYMLHAGVVANSKVNYTCATISEQPVSVPSATTIEAGLASQLQHLIYDGSFKSGQTFWINNVAKGPKTCTALVVSSKTGITLTRKTCTSSYPVLCTQSIKRSSRYATYNANSTNALSINGLTAYRDAFSFRFMKLPYANTPQRFTASSVYVLPTTITANTTVPGNSTTCLQPGSPSSGEDCLITNVYTSVVSAKSTAGNPLALLPIMLWIHGGAFITGSGQDPTFDGGSLASRGDVVVVTPNYRLGTLGFLSVDNTTMGNWAFGDLITCLKWIKQNAATFGGDATKITIFGQSAGAQLVAALIASPAAKGLFQNAIIQSGRPADNANSLTTAAIAQAGPCNTTIQSLGCGNTTSPLSCLNALNSSAFLSGSVFARNVIDGKLVTQPNIDVAQLRGGTVNRVNVLMGFMRDESASLDFVPNVNTSLSTGLRQAGIKLATRNMILNNTDLFPVANTTNGNQNLTVTVETDSIHISRCGQEATMYSAASTGIFKSLWGYTQDQRAYQISGYDPYGVCSNTVNATGTYMCHSGDLYPVFNSAGYTAKLPVRDADDIVHSALMMDYWTSFARSGNPNPPSAYLTSRNYTTTAARIKHNSWTQVTSGNLSLISLGPYPTMIDLAIRGEQCDAYGLPIDYISQGN
jgi:carboxylesterase type B